MEVRKMGSSLRGRVAGHNHNPFGAARLKKPGTASCKYSLTGLKL
jgi:hypothetical protein